MATLVPVVPVYYYLIELSCSQNIVSDVSKETPRQIFQSVLEALPLYENPQKYGAPTSCLAANVPSSMIGQYDMVSQQYKICTNLNELPLSNICNRLSSSKHCTIKIIRRLYNESCG